MNWLSLMLAVISGSPLVTACVAVDGDRILVRHLSEVNDDFRSADASAFVGLAPHSGVTRVIRTGELKAIASRMRIALKAEPVDICFVKNGGGDRDESSNNAEIRRGEHVEVEARSGSAQLRFEANAESNGRTGDTVLIRNPVSNRLFAAKVIAKGKVAVQK